MKKQTLIISLVLLLLPLYSWAGLLKGRIVDENKTPLSFVSVKLTQTLEDQKTKTLGTVTDDKGYFLVPNVGAGVWQVEYSFIGYITQTRTVNFKTKDQDISLKTMVLKEDTQALDEIEVVGQSSQMRFDIDKKVFNVAASVTAAGASTSEMLENIPSVEVDQDGEISLRGNSDVIIWINGKPSGLDSDNRAQILQQMPAGSIKEVQIITNPSAKYDPEGTAGIINLVLKKEQKSGYTGSVTSGISFDKDQNFGYNLGASFGLSASKYESRINIGYRDKSRGGSMTSDRYYFNAGGSKANPNSILHQTADMDRSFYGLSLNGNFDYHLTSKQTLGVNFMVMNGGMENETTTKYIQDTFLPTAQTVDYTRVTSQDATRPTWSLSLNHSYTWSDDVDLQTSLSYSDHHMDKPDQTYVSTSPFANYNSEQLQDMDGHFKQTIFKSDLTYKFNESSKVEAGIYDSYMDRTSNTVSWNTLDKTSEDPFQYSDFNYYELVSAGYATYSLRMGNFGTNLGLRGEYTSTKVETRDDEAKAYESTTTDYLKLFPSVFFSYSLPHSNELQLNYTRRIHRPRGRELNATVNLTDPTNISYGNPYLEPEYANAYELSWIKSWTGQMFTTSIYYRQVENLMQRVSFMDANGVMNTTYDNLSGRTEGGFEFISKNRLFQWWNTTTSVEYAFSDLDAVYYDTNLDGTKEKLSDADQLSAWKFRLLSNFQVTRSLSAQLTGQYDSERIQAQGKRGDYFVIDLGVKKSFLKRKLNVSLNVRDLFDTREWNSQSWGDTFYQDLTFNPAGLSTRLSASYSFGNLKNQYKKRGPKGGDSTNDNTEDMQDMDTDF